MRDQLDQVLASYEAAWNEPALSRRVELLNESVTDDVVLYLGYKPPSPPCTGIDAVSHEMGEMISSRPSTEVRLSLRGGFDAHHGWVRFAWSVGGPDGEPLEVNGMRIEGIDIAHIAEDGRLDTIIVFIG